MNFQKYEREMNNFLDENYQNLKRIKVANSEFAFKELVQTEQADINNYTISLVRKIAIDVRKSFVEELGDEKGYELGEKYKTSIKPPVFNQIEVIFKKEIPINKQDILNATEQHTVQRKTVQKFESKSPANQYRARNFAVGTGTATAIIVYPAARLLTRASFGTSLFVVGLSAIVVAGIVYTVIKYVDDNGKQQKEYVPQTQVQAPTPKTKPSANAGRKAIDQASMSNLLDVRKAEAKKVLLKTIKDAEKKYIQMQVHTV
ncbi:hypothetical protein D8M04_13595 [Oceanobacillus piezotolerans]|uniref:Uncharacterized protein n=1 Tax=Oceanobacillus piezotolerans TaxID=2448030 RepID=A0A498DCR0_9BACI|nr:hypothetical protein [Oceanobacillus piezotolerans]RLL43931.1 hypothetical protein D8M04_13595 [Oceanobacillus piezotolerans]